MKFPTRKVETMKVPAVPAAATKDLPAPAQRRSPHEFATRNCIRCGTELPGDDGSVSCPRCRRPSEIALCEHRKPEPAWRITRWAASRTNAPRASDVVAVTIGDHTVYLGRFRDALALRTEDGARLPLLKVRSVEPGSEIIERLTNLGTCWRCRTAFFLPDCEVQASGEPRILRAKLDAPTREYQRPMADPVAMSAAYLALGTRVDDDL
jgi:hypothetical protein